MLIILLNYRFHEARVAVLFDKLGFSFGDLGVVGLEINFYVGVWFRSVGLRQTFSVLDLLFG